MKRTIFSTAFALLIAFCSQNALAEGTPSAKSAVAMSGIALIDSTTGTDGWAPVLGAQLKVAEQKDLAVDVSLECGLYTSTTVRSKGGEKDTSTAQGSVKVRVAVIDQDGNLFQYAGPGGAEGIVFARRSQELTAKFQGMVEGCMSVDDTGAVILDQECLEPEELGLVLDTMNANAFNFLAPNLSSGLYRVVVEAKIDSGASAQAGSAEALATVGRGSMLVEEIRLVGGAAGDSL